MSDPRQILPLRCYFVTRRALLRLLLFYPDTALMAEIFWYCLGLACERTGVEVHQTTLMSSHPHLIVTDVNENLPDFVEHLNKNLARCTNGLRGREGQVFDQKGVSLVELQDEDAILRETVYSITNPVEAGLVPHASDWPGVCVLPQHLGTLVKRVDRPKVYFAEESELPAQVTVRITIPPAFAHLGVEGWQALVAEKVAEREKEIRAEREAAGKSFLGVNALRVTKWSDRAIGEEKPRIGRTSPRWAGAKHLREKRQKEYREFKAAHYAACNRFERGEETLFPAGSWWMKKRWHVRCVPASDEPVPTARSD